MLKALATIVEGLASSAASRNYLSAVAGAGTILVVLGAIDADSAKGLVDGAQQFMDGLGQMLGGAKKIFIIIGPVVAALCAKYAGVAASLRGRLTSIAKDPDVKIEGKIIAPPAVADAVPSAQVVAKAAVLIAALLLGTLTMAGDAYAQSKVQSIAKRNDANRPAASTAGPASVSFLIPAGQRSLPDVLADLAAKGTADLQAADAIASAIDPDTKQMADEVAHTCYPALIRFIAGLPKPPADGTRPGPAQVFERARIARMTMQTGLPNYLKIGCAPLVQDEANFLVKILALAGVAVGTGGLAIPAVPGLLPALPLLP